MSEMKTFERSNGMGLLDLEAMVEPIAANQKTDFPKGAKGEAKMDMELTNDPLASNVMGST